MSKKRIPYDFIKEPNRILDRLIQKKFSGEERKIIAVLKICLLGHNPPIYPVTLKTLSEMTGILKRNLIRSRKALRFKLGSVRNEKKYLPLRREIENREPPETQGGVSEMRKKGVRNEKKGCQKRENLLSGLKDSIKKESIEKEVFQQDIKNNFTAMPRDIVHKETFFSIPGREGQVFDLLKRLTFGYRQTFRYLTAQYIVQRAYIPVQSVYRALRNLEEHKLIYRRGKHLYAISRDVSSWKSFNKKQVEPVYKKYSERPTKSDLREELLQNFTQGQRLALEDEEKSLGRKLNSWEVAQFIGQFPESGKEQGFQYYSVEYSESGRT